jgi:hypothetical protein
MGAGSASSAPAGDDEPGWEYHVGSMGRHGVPLFSISLSFLYISAAHFKDPFHTRKWQNGSSRSGTSMLDALTCLISHSLVFPQGFFNSAEIFLRRAGDRLFVSSRSTDLSSFFE